jgi:hypothetical protein
MCSLLAATGFPIDFILEPNPTKEFQQIDPAGYERLCKNPWFLVVRAVRKDVGTIDQCRRQLMITSYLNPAQESGARLFKKNIAGEKERGI